MKTSSFHILRVGTAITFLWIGILILREPEAWGLYLQPWATELLLLPLKEIMIGTAFLDIAIGILLLTNTFTWFAALIGALHLIIVLVTSGINAITVRDIGLLTATLALTVHAWPNNVYLWKKRNKKF